MVERCPGPGRCGVAGGAGCRESRRRVIGIHRSGVIGLVARIAIRRGSGENSSDVARVAGHAYVRAGQWERRVVMIKGSVEPGRGRVANRAVLRKSGGHMIGNSIHGGSVVVIVDVATVAGGWQSACVVVRVASGARHGGVGAGERERGGVVVEGGVQPRRGGMAQRAILREISGDVIGHAGDRGSAGVVLGVATVAIRRQRAREVVGVASRARHRGMRARQWEGRGVVIKRRVQPGRSRVALRTIL